MCMLVYVCVGGRERLGSEQGPSHQWLGKSWTPHAVTVKGLGLINTHTLTHTTGCFAGSCNQSVAVSACDGRLILSPSYFFFRLSVYPLFFSLWLADLLFVSVYPLIFVSLPLLFSFSFLTSACHFLLPLWALTLYFSSHPIPSGFPATFHVSLCYFMCCVVCLPEWKQLLSAQQNWMFLSSVLWPLHSHLSHLSWATDFLLVM